LCTHVIRYDEGGGKRSRTVFGFMAINGNDVVMVSDTARAGDMVSFLRLIRRENPRRRIVVVLDNARVHRARFVGEVAERLGIFLLFFLRICLI